jgi:uncharacterized protein RhaS with RHS repeats
MGRFTSVDPLLESASVANPQTWNRYTYVLNNPLNFVDPYGLEPRWVHDIKKDLYFSVSDEDFAANYDGVDGFEEVTNIGAEGLEIKLNNLEGSYAEDAEYQALKGQKVYLGEDGRFHPVSGTVSPGGLYYSDDVKWHIVGDHGRQGPWNTSKYLYSADDILSGRDEFETIMRYNDAIKGKAKGYPQQNGNLIYTYAIPPDNQ